LKARRKVLAEWTQQPKKCATIRPNRRLQDRQRSAIILGARPPLTPQSSTTDFYSAASESRRAARRASSNRTPDKHPGERELLQRSSPSPPAASSDEIKPIFRRAASTKAAQSQRRPLSLGARAAPYAPDAGGSQWFLPVDGTGTDPMGDVNVSPQEWVDEWLSEVASDEGTYTEGLSP